SFVDGIALGDVVPRIGLGLFEAERNAVLILIDAQDDNRNDVAFFHNLARVADALGPAHLTDRDQTIHALFQLDEGAEIGQAGDAALQLLLRRIALRDRLPRIGLDLLEAKRDLAGLAIDFQNGELKFLIRRDDVGRTRDAAPAHVRD